MSTIRELRAVKNWSQQDLATHAHLTTAVVSRAENGRSVDKKTLYLICQALGVSEDAVEGVVVSKRVGRNTRSA